MHPILFTQRRWALACCAALASSPAAALDAPQLYINDAPPFSYVAEGREAGLVYELLDQMAAHAGIRSSISSVPFKRIAVQLNLRPNSLGAMWRQPEVELSYTWILKLLEESAMLVARSDTVGDISSIDAARKLRVGVVLGSPAEVIARRLGFQHIEVATNAASNARKLQLGRIDAWIAVPSVIAAAQLQIGSDLGALRFGPPIEKIAMYLSCAAHCKDIDIDRWRRAAWAMKKDGSYARIVDKYARIQLQGPELVLAIANCR